MTTAASKIPGAVVVDTRDGYTFWRDHLGELFTPETASAFATCRSEQHKPGSGRFRAFILIQDECPQCGYEPGSIACSHCGTGLGPGDECAICVPGQCPGTGECPGNYGTEDESARERCTHPGCLDPYDSHISHGDH